MGGVDRSGLCGIKVFCARRVPLAASVKGAAMSFSTRLEAGERLGEACRGLVFEKPLILGLARGGVAVASALARVLDAPMDIILVRKIGAPGHPELAAAAVVDGRHPVIVFNEEVIAQRSIERSTLRTAAAEVLREIERRRELYMRGRPPVDLTDRDIILVDDGAATGSSLRAAVDAVRPQSPLRITIALPVAAPEALAVLRRIADQMVCLVTPPDFRSVGEAYADFHQLTDEEVIALVASSRSRPGEPPSRRS